MPYASRQDRLAYLREYRGRVRDTRSRTEYQRAKRNRLREYINQVKSGPCVDCGGKFHYAAMDFDHRPGEIKRSDINRLVSANKSIQVIMDEIAKCDLVCSNCHRIRTWSRMQGDPA